MKPELQRKALASHLKWEKCPYDDVSYYVPINDKVAVACDPLKDLNAMHEAENTLPVTLRSFYCDYLIHGRVNPPETKVWGRWQVVNATASQRAEAFLRTLNLWQEDETK